MPHTAAINVFGKPAISEILHAEQQLDNAVDKLAVKIIKNNETIAIFTRTAMGRARFLIYRWFLVQNALLGWFGG